MSRRKYSRQQVVPRAVHNKHALIVGCGAIGRNIAVQLTSMGVKELTLYDADTVEMHNVVSQGFFETDVGTKKVEAVKDFCRKLNTDVRITANDTVWLPHFTEYDYVFLAADCMNARANISAKSIA